MKISVDPAISERIRAAWKELTPEDQKHFGDAIAAAHQQAATVARTGTAPSVPAAPHELMLAQSVINNDLDSVMNKLDAGAVLDVGVEGVMWGTGRYQQIDPGWAESLACFLENRVFGGTAPFVDAPQIIDIPNSVQVALIGDWGTGDWGSPTNFAASTNVRTQVNRLAPHVTVHLGDVYYAGTDSEERNLFVKLWPQGSVGSFALNSNHEMYAGAKPYFQAIAAYPFGQQNGCSYFALQNQNWVIIGLDSAYFASPSNLYRDGALYSDNTLNKQCAFLRDTVQEARQNAKKVVVLTHHNGLADTGDGTTDLWTQVTGPDPATNAPDYWYWGHLHAGLVYKPKGTIRCRCSGHGGIPWGTAATLDPASNPNVSWCETRSAGDPDNTKRVLNGFTMLYLDGPNIREVFYDEKGGLAWSSDVQAVSAAQGD